jgi:hypothetical protein
MCFGFFALYARIRYLAASRFGLAGMLKLCARR